MEYKISQADFEDWLNSSVTKELFSLILEHRQASYKVGSELPMTTYPLSKLDLTEVARYQGQVNAFDTVLDITSFIKEKLNSTKEVINEEIDSLRGQFNN